MTTKPHKLSKTTWIIVAVVSVAVIAAVYLLFIRKRATVSSGQLISGGIGSDAGNETLEVQGLVSVPRSGSGIGFIRILPNVKYGYTIPPGTVLKRYNYYSGYYKVEYDGTIGWVYKDDVIELT